jgi:hypothetical protein
MQGMSLQQPLEKVRAISKSGTRISERKAIRDGVRKWLRPRDLFSTTQKLIQGISDIALSCLNSPERGWGWMNEEEGKEHIMRSSA